MKNATFTDLCQDLVIAGIEGNTVSVGMNTYNDSSVKASAIISEVKLSCVDNITFNLDSTTFTLRKEGILSISSVKCKAKNTVTYYYSDKKGSTYVININLTPNYIMIAA